MISALLVAAFLPFSEASLEKVFHGRDGALVLIDCASGESRRYNPPLCARRLPPCSTFKIWNTAIGLETGLLAKADQPFYKWDGVVRSIGEWNQDLTLRQAYAFSCVPAYQALARKIGAERMNGWMGKLDYGDSNTSSGNDVFWLPAPDREPLLISADEQASLLRRLVTGDVPFSKTTLTILQDIMTAKKTDRGTLYGKTGTGGAGKGTPSVGWYVGYVVSGERILAFACVLTGSQAAGKEARSLVEEVLSREGAL